MTSSPIAYCHNRKHWGYLNAGAMTEHRCLEKGCPYLQKIPNRYWIGYERKQNQRKLYKELCKKYPRKSYREIKEMARKMAETTRDKIIKALRDTKRPGMEKLIGWMDENGFFTAPASGANHSNQAGGLAEHSFNVYMTATEVWTDLMGMKNPSVTIVSLLHDIGKCGYFGKSYYAPNVLKGGKVSDAKPWMRNSELLEQNHAALSVLILSKFIELTQDEYFAILHHDGLYIPENYGIKGKETQLYMVLHFADLWASRAEG